MKLRIQTGADRYGFNVIARFGRARLLARPDGRAELEDGSAAEQTEAKEWISLFRHETVLRVNPLCAFPNSRPRSESIL